MSIDHKQIEDIRQRWKNMKHKVCEECMEAALKNWGKQCYSCNKDTEDAIEAIINENLITEDDWNRRQILIKEEIKTKMENNNFCYGIHYDKGKTYAAAGEDIHTLLDIINKLTNQQ